MYIAGNWARAEDLLGTCQALSPYDGPTNTLKNIIEQENGTAPGNWKGFRILSRK